MNSVVLASDSVTAWAEPFDDWSFDNMTRAARIAVKRFRCAESEYVGDPVETAWEGVALAVAGERACSWQAAVAEGARVLAQDMFHQRNPGGRGAGQRHIEYWRDQAAYSLRRSRPDDLPVHPAYAMSCGGQLDRIRIRVGSLGGERGGAQRAAWERTYYPEIVGGEA